MSKSLLKLIEAYQNSHEALESCQLAMQKAYPELQLRWSRIYGSRWAYLAGSNADEISCHPQRFILSPEYGLCVDNAEVLSPHELKNIIQTLEVCLANASNKS